MITTKINSAETWYMSQERIPSSNGNTAICTGYGTTPDSAIADCMRAVEHTKRLQRQLNIINKPKQTKQ